MEILTSLKKNKGLWIFMGIALVVAILLGVFVSPYASSSPDGLEKVAADKGFLDKAEEARPAWDRSPMKDYAVPGVQNEKASTGLSGLIGVLVTVVATMGLALAAFWLGKVLRRKKSETGTPASEA
jgi:flagellar basal body-associated protein FliL